MLDKFTLQIDTVNDSFGDRPVDKTTEIACILHQLADRLDGSITTSGRVRDANGNTVGHFQFE